LNKSSGEPYVDEQGGVGIRLEPAAAIVRQYGEQFRRETRPEANGKPAETFAVAVGLRDGTLLPKLCRRPEQ
jgi:hypothetical protein